MRKDGCTVVANHHPSEADAAETWKQARAAAGFTIAIFAADVSSFEDSARMVNEITEQHGPIDILVNCAGITRDKTFKKMEAAHWNAVINVNLNSVFNFGFVQHSLRTASGCPRPAFRAEKAKRSETN